MISALEPLAADHSAQLRRFAEVAVLGEKDEAERRSICVNLAKTIKIMYDIEAVAVSPFGSSVNGLGLRGCDLDMMVKMGKCEMLSRLPWVELC